MSDQAAIAPRQVPVPPEQVVPVLLAIFLAFQLGAALLVETAGTAGTALADWLLIALPVVIVLRMQRAPLAATLRLHAPRPSVLGATVLLALGAVGAAALWMALQGAALGGFAWYREAMGEFDATLNTSTVAELVLLLVTVGATAALCEELLFRGYVLRGLEPVLARPALCGLVGLLFGLFHANLLQLVPAALIGALLTWLALVADSLWPPVLMHFLFNAATLTGRHLAARGDLAEQSAWQVTLAIALTAIALPLGFLWLRTSTRINESTNQPVNQTGVNP